MLDPNHMSPDLSQEEFIKVDACTREIRELLDDRLEQRLRAIVLLYLTGEQIALDSDCRDVEEMAEHLNECGKLLIMAIRAGALAKMVEQGKTGRSEEVGIKV